jgi:hypothetical protein
VSQYEWNGKANVLNRLADALPRGFETIIHDGADPGGLCRHCKQRRGKHEGRHRADPATRALCPS